MTIGNFFSPNPTISGDNASRIFNIDDGNASTELSVKVQNLTLRDGNAQLAGGAGGAIRSAEDFEVSHSWIRESRAIGPGGGIAQVAGSLQISNSTISENYSQAFGGGVSMKIEAGQSGYMTNSTISDNSSDLDGGGVDVEQNGGVAVINHSTISGNFADVGEIGSGDGGGLHVFAGSVFLENSIIARNESGLGAAPDVTGSLYLYGSLIGDNTDSGLSPAPVGSPDGDGNLIGTAAAPINPQIGPLDANGGVTPTRALAPTSPAIDGGLDFGESYDQRGVRWARGVDGNGDFNAGPDMGAFEFIPILPLQVDVNHGYDDGIMIPGHLSLSEAVVLANAYPGHNTISFSETLIGGTITLDGEQIDIKDSVDIVGLGAQALMVSGGNASRILRVDDQNDTILISVNIDGLSLVNGNAPGDGGAIVNVETLTISNSVLSGNVAGDNGGAIGSTGNLTVTNSSLTNNSGGFSGGAIYSKTDAETSLRVENSTISGNVADTAGGLKTIGEGYATIAHSTVVNNSARTPYGVGGIGSYYESFTLDHSIIAQNTKLGGVSSDLYLSTDVNPTVVRYSFIGDGTRSYLSSAPIGSPDANGNFIGTLAAPIDPDIGPLALNGGTTPSHELLPGSSAENVGDPAFTGDPFFDQRGVPYDRVIGRRIDMGSIESQPLSTLTGDFDGDDDYDLVDIDLLTATIASGVFNLQFDLVPDGEINLLDRDAWLAEAGDAILGSGQTFLLGDSNLDGSVDGADFLTWSANKFTNSSAWSDGDFNADGSVDGWDFLIWNANKFQSSGGTSPGLTGGTTRYQHVSAKDLRETAQQNREHGENSLAISWAQQVDRIFEASDV